MFFALLIAACAQLGINSTAHAQRVALLIGNSSYQSAPLTNPPNDVREMEAALRVTGFKVQKVLNANQVQMKRAVRDFGEAAKGAELAFLYYSGHGTQVQGQNYLIPVGAEAGINKESDYEIEAVSINHIMGQIAAAEPRAAVVVLDSCRNNPFARSIKSAQKGMARIVSPQGILVAYATSPDNTADDNGHYAKALAGHITTPGLELVQVFRNTAKQVQKSSNGKQIPFIGDLSINDSVYLASIKPEPVPTPAPRPVNPAPLLVPTPLPTQAPVIQTAATCAYCPEMVVIPSGSFTMGSNEDADEKPPHSVSIKSFALGKYEVTQGQWKAVMGSNPSRFSSCGDSCPVENVSWDDIQQYIQKLNAQSGRQYRLPSEAEWEYAARAGTKTPYWWGDKGSHEYANYGKDECCGGLAQGRDRWENTAPVGQFPSNAFGLHDMHGNVSEWVQDYYHDSYSGAPTDGSAWDSGGEQKLRVLRGGSWYSFAAFLRSVFRGRNAPVDRYNYSGFRVARTLLTP
jgi:formylglycine-generating enzyme required for sulfatase activity